MEDTTSSAGAPATAQPSYVQSLLDPAVDGVSLDNSNEQVSREAGREETAAPPVQETTPDAEAAAPEGQPSGAAPSLDDLIRQFAQETGLNPDDPNERRTLKRLADKEMFIRKLQLDNDLLKAGAKPEPAAPPQADHLTEFEREVATRDAAPRAPAGPPTGPAAATPSAPPSVPEPIRYNDIGDEWKDDEDALTALNEAWREKDLKKVNAVEVARLKRTFDREIAPHLLGYIDQMFSRRIGSEPSLAEARRGVAERRLTENREFAVKELEKAGVADVRKLFEREEGPPIVVDGQEFERTRLNQILVENPEVMDIVKRHPDPATAERMTLIARLRHAARLMSKANGGGLPAEAAQRLVDAGRGIAESQTADRTRQSINAGPGATGAGRESPRKGSYVSELNSLPGEIPLSSLL